MSPEDNGGDATLIPRIADQAADAANAAAIDHLVGTTRYRFIAAWGKFLGITPHVVQTSVLAAEMEGAPENAIQKLNGKWQTLNDIVCDQNRKMVEHIAVKGAGWSR